MTLLVGTSGWQYADWRGVFYPPGVPQRKWLDHYANTFATVELNAAFYRPVKPETFANWRDRTPGDFVMAVKASRVITHYRRLRDPDVPLDRVLGAARELGDKLGPILFQLPPDLEAVPDRLRDMLDLIPRQLRVVVEPRHASWWTPAVRSVLADHGAALCWADRHNRPTSPLWHTTDWAYLRFHESTGARAPGYPDRTLERWIGRLDHICGRKQDAYVYFNNDRGGNAIHDAARFAELARAAGWPVARAGREATTESGGHAVVQRG
ncbi:DUF72 domain-containing protein [Nocardia stercoris]|uniref:DUF72 domain-containing protein n=1 Tax=Nocardia stercoris TaxID=2483361 RepID=A0A3M2L1K0_9NOCA|nr:DUF72 domain-containing protein [Nocardia stercoris]RMI30383.1 DUF72 domain-containing protein [Nocardia stercoris]